MWNDRQSKLGGSTAGIAAIVHFSSVGRLLGLFEHSKATQDRTGLYPSRPHNQTTRGRPATDRHRTASSQCSTSALPGGPSGGAIDPDLLESGLKLLQRPSY